ncbi:ABC1 kinase family protein [Flexibacterium corallicola]|uniref:ABC1 kinase family protein n=1 Tax=Flexibacterium corallicola TaxID=3037259 RepID=UPI00286EC895|nr:AarF/UbiB family protein [Pseudovibrio sp. M1P-2-3]
MVEKDWESNRLTARMGRYARVGSNVGGLAAKMAALRLVGFGSDSEKNASEVARVLGELKGPLMKVAQLLSTVPDLVPPEYAAELGNLQSNAPPMGWPFVKRRMQAELGPSWKERFSSFEHVPSAAASLGQVHRAAALEGEALACKLQYPEMDSAVEADLSQFNALLALHKRFRPAIDTQEVAKEIGARLREELDYFREAKHMALYALIFANEPQVRIPNFFEELSTRRLLTMSWLEGKPILDYRGHSQEDRNNLSKVMFKAWWYPFSHFGVIHGDPHLGNYSVFEDSSGSSFGINLLDYGCLRIFPPTFVQGVVDLYRGLLEEDQEQIVSAYELWGFEGLTKPLIEVLNVWARFIYGPLLTDRTRSLVDGVSPAAYGRKEAFYVHQSLKELGPIRIPRYFVFMDRAAIGLGGVFLHLKADLNFYRLFNEQIDGFTLSALEQRQAEALELAQIS